MSDHPHPYGALYQAVYGDKGRNRCPDCGGPHGRGYHTCPTPYVNAPPEPPPNYAEIEARLMAAYTEQIGAAVYKSLMDSRGASVTMRVSLMHDELLIEPVDMRAGAQV